jgi:mRNA interferase MazF
LKRGEIWWASLPDPVASEPGGRRPVLILSNDEFNRSRLRTVIVVSITTNLKLADLPGNLYIDQNESGLPRDAVINMTQISTIDRGFLTEYVSILGDGLMQAINTNLKLMFDLL